MTGAISPAFSAISARDPSSRRPRRETSRQHRSRPLHSPADTVVALVSKGGHRVRSVTCDHRWSDVPSSTHAAHFARSAHGRTDRNRYLCRPYPRDVATRTPRPFPSRRSRGPMLGSSQGVRPRLIERIVRDVRSSQKMSDSRLMSSLDVPQHRLRVKSEASD